MVRAQILGTSGFLLLCTLKFSIEPTDKDHKPRHKPCALPNSHHQCPPNHDLHQRTFPYPMALHPFEIDTNDFFFPSTTFCHNDTDCRNNKEGRSHHCFPLALTTHLTLIANPFEAKLSAKQ